MFSRFLKVAIATSSFMNEVYNGGFSPGFSFKSLKWIPATTFKELIQFGQDPRGRRPRSVSLKKDFIFQFQLYFSTSFAFHFLVSYT